MIGEHKMEMEEEIGEKDLAIHYLFLIFFPMFLYSSCLDTHMLNNQTS